MICMEVDGMKRVLFKVILPLAFIVVWLDMCYWIWIEDNLIGAKMYTIFKLGISSQSTAFLL